MNKHTPEPWVFGGVCEVYKDGVIIADFGYEYNDINPDSLLPLQANAKRTIACVNALVGIDEPAKYVERVYFLEMEHQQIKDQRDELQTQVTELKNDLQRERWLRVKLVNALKLGAQSWRQLAEATGEEGLLPEDLTYQSMLDAISANDKLNAENESGQKRIVFEEKGGVNG